MRQKLETLGLRILPLAYVRVLVALKLQHLSRKERSAAYRRSGHIPEQPQLHLLEGPLRIDRTNHSD